MILKASFDFMVRIWTSVREYDCSVTLHASFFYLHTLDIILPVAQWLKHPTGVRRLGSCSIAVRERRTFYFVPQSRQEHYICPPVFITSRDSVEYSHFQIAFNNDFLLILGLVNGLLLERIIVHLQINISFFFLSKLAYKITRVPIFAINFIKICRLVQCQW